MKINVSNLFLLTLVIALSVVLYIKLTQEPPEISISSDGDSMSWRATQGDLYSTPPWKSTEEHPPLSIRQAISITKDIAENLEQATKHKNIGYWELECLFITQLNGPYRDKWGYVAKFSGTTLPASDAGIEALVYSGPQAKMSMLILMDGTVLPGYCPEIRHLYTDVEKIYPRKEYPNKGDRPGCP